MNIIVGCSFTISKKLEALLEPGEPVFIQINAVHGNKGIGHMTMSAKRLPAPSDIGNTSLMLDAISVDESAPNFQDVQPVSTFFSGNVEGEQHDSPVTRFAKVNPDAEQGSYKGQWARKTSQDGPRRAQPARREPEPPVTIEEPQEAHGEPQEAPQEETQGQPATIMGYDELIAEVESIGNVDFETPAPRSGAGQLSRAEAVKIEKQGKLAPRIKRPAFVRNVRGGHIEIADMDEKIGDSEVFDLGRVPAKRLRDSRDLKWCLDNGILQFCSREEYLHWLENRDSSTLSHDHGIKAYSGPHAAEQAADDMFREGPDPMVRSSRGDDSHERIRNAPRLAVVKAGNDILDTESTEEYEDPDDAQRKRLIDTMDPGGRARDTAPRYPHQEPARRPPVQGGGARIKSIRKV